LNILYLYDLTGFLSKAFKARLALTQTSPCELQSRLDGFQQKANSEQRPTG